MRDDAHQTAHAMHANEAARPRSEPESVLASRKRRTLILGGLAVSGLAIAEALKPRDLLARTRTGYDYDALVPPSFPGWAAVELQQGQIVDPSVVETINRFYSQTVTRAYLDPAQQLLMLSLAYGEVQNDEMRVHLPEVCYAAQGFQVTMLGAKPVHIDDFTLPVNMVSATQGSRKEIVSYFVKVGDILVGRGLKRKLAAMEYSMRGIIPDGLLVRVSSFGDDATQAFNMHRRFFTQLYDASDAKGRQAIFGRRKA